MRNGIARNAEQGSVLACRYAGAMPGNVRLLLRPKVEKALREQVRISVRGVPS